MLNYTELCIYINNPGAASIIIAKYLSKLIVYGIKCLAKHKLLLFVQ